MRVTFSKTAFFAAAGAVAFCLATPAFAASAATDAFVANVHPNVDLLDQSSRLASDNATSGKVRAFARGEATEQTLAGDQLVAWTQTRTAAPPDVAEGVGTGLDDVLTGRSVAIDTPVITVTRPRTAAPGTLLPSGEAEMARLSAMKGKRFDAFYVTTQKDALRQLVTLYTDYARDGDDPALRAMAERQLPVVKQRLGQLSGL